MKRPLKHLFTPDWLAMRAFPASALQQIEAAIKESETRHDGEIRFVVEASLPISFSRRPSRTRAEHLFSSLRVWDTERNSGVLVYIQLVDRRIEIVADRGIAAKVAQAEWQAICHAMESAFKNNKYLEGALQAIRAITDILARHFPPRGRNPNELPDKPVIL